jgi:hypothetical protein
MMGKVQLLCVAIALGNFAKVVETESKRLVPKQG